MVKPEFSERGGYMQYLLGVGIVYLSDSTNKMAFLGIMTFI